MTPIEEYQSRLRTLPFPLLERLCSWGENYWLGSLEAHERWKSFEGDKG